MKNLVKTLASLVSSLLLLTTIIVVLSKYGLGSPAAGLGSRGYLTKGQLDELKRSLGLDEPLWQTLLRFLSSIPRGGPPSLTYGKPSIELAMSYLSSTLIVIVPSFLLSVLMTSLVSVLTGFKASRGLGALAFVPEYFYAVLLYLASWNVGWPDPLPRITLGKELAYSIIIIMSEFPKLLHSLAGLYEDTKGELKDVIIMSKAIGLSDFRINLKILRTLLAPFISYSLYSFAMLVERVVLIEPFISFPGIGSLLYSSVINADLFLSAASFMLLGSISLAVASASPLLEGLVDPRLRR